MDDLFAQMSPWQKLQTLMQGYGIGIRDTFSEPKVLFNHLMYPEQLKVMLNQYNPEIGMTRTDRSPLDRAINYGGGYQFGSTSSLPIEDIEKMAKAYQLRGYLLDQLTGASPERLRDASMDYYENMEGVRAAREEKESKPNIRKKSAEYAKRK